MNDQLIISIVAILVSGALGLSGVLLNLRKFRDSESIEQAVRRTMALQMLTEEELALSKVETECRSIELLIHMNREKLSNAFEHLQSEAHRIIQESSDMLQSVRARRALVYERIQSMKAHEIESIIADSYHGKMIAEAQLHRTTRSREDTIKIYLNEA